jgi:hypothetical protein
MIKTDTMKKLILLTALALITISCAKQSDVDCLSEKLNTIERYDNLIELANDDSVQQQNLISEKRLALSKLDC